MLQENLQINIGANTQDLQAGLNQATNSVTNFSNSVQKASKPTADATNALSNLSRVAQDAPYGFMGIANNLNPLLESFQRLQKESGSAGGALKAMASSLMGPAGIGLALGTVSSLLVVFGDKLFQSSDKQKELAEKTKEHNDALKEQKNAIEQIYSATAKEATQVSTLIAVLQNENETRYRKQKALEELKKLNPDIFSGLKIEEGAVVGLNEAYDKYINSLSSIITLKIKQKELEDITEKILKSQGVTLSQQEKDINAVGKAINDKVNAQRTDIEQRNLATKALIDQNKKEQELNGLLEQRKKIFDSIKDVSSGVKLSGGTSGGGGGAVSTTVNKDEQQVTNIIQKLREAEKSLDYQLSSGKIGEISKNDKDKGSYFTQKIDAISDAIKKLAGLTSGEAKKALSELETELSKTKVADIGKRMERRDIGIENAMSERQLDPVKTERNLALMEKDTKLNEGKSEDAKVKALDKDLKQAQKTAEGFANTISQQVTGGLMTMWDAMENGENPLEALGNMFKDLLKQLVAAVAQALIFQGIMMLINPAGAAAGGGGLGGGLIGGIGKIFGFAEGGIVSQPTLSMVGEGGQSEAIMPLNKLGTLMNSTFNAGAMSGQGGGAGNGQFVLKGNDLVLAMQRSNFSLNVRR